jgi:hypothetical protein
MAVNTFHSAIIQKCRHALLLEYKGLHIGIRVEYSARFNRLAVSQMKC